MATKFTFDLVTPLTSVSTEQTNPALENASETMRASAETKAGLPRLCPPVNNSSTEYNKYLPRTLSPGSRSGGRGGGV